MKALFGAPVAHEDHAQRASYAALSIQKALENYSEKLKQNHGKNFKMPIGPNFGPVVVASMGVDYYLAWVSRDFKETVKCYMECASI